MLALIVAGTASADPVTSSFSVNQAFLDNEASGSPSTTNGQFTYGYTLNPYSLSPNTPTAYGGIQTVAYSHTTDWASTQGLSGFYVNNNYIVPAIVANVTDTSMTTGFGVTLAPGELLLHPGGVGSDATQSPIYDADIQYKTTTAGTYSLDGSFNLLDSGSPDVHVFINGVSVFDGNLSSLATSAAFNLVETLSVGDTVDFLVGNNANGTIYNDSTGLFANVEMVPEPSTLISSGIAAVMSSSLFLRRRKLAASIV